MKIIDMHTHAQDILFPKGPSHVRPSRGLLIRAFEWSRFTMQTSPRLQQKLRKRVACETQGRNAMACVTGLRRGMQQAGITHSVVLPVEPYGSTSEVISLANEDSGLIPFASIDPHDPQRVGKLRDYVKAGCRGLKLHPIIQDFHPSGTQCMETVEEFSQYDLPVFFHSGQTAYYVPESESEQYGHPGRYVDLFAAFPGVKFVLGHMAMFEADTAIEIAQDFGNVYLETSFQPIQKVKKALDKIGDTRVLFGTDWPFAGQRYELAVVLDLTEGNPGLRERLLSKNAEDLIGPV